MVRTILNDQPGQVTLLDSNLWELVLALLHPDDEAAGSDGIASK